AATCGAASAPRRCASTACANRSWPASSTRRPSPGPTRSSSASASHPKRSNLALTVLLAKTALDPFALACPNCHTPLDIADERVARCKECSATFQKEEGIWRFLPGARQAAYEQFEREYHTVRRAEGWGSNDASYYRSLPWRDVSGRFSHLWRIRATTF